MKLPNGTLANIHEAKLFNYLLSPTDPEGAPKAAFFEMIGYTKENADLLKTQLLEIARSGEVVLEIKSPFGTKYVIDGQIERSGGRGILIRTVWVINNAESMPQLVTAYPL